MKKNEEAQWQMFWASLHHSLEKQLELLLLLHRSIATKHGVGVLLGNKQSDY